MKDSEHSFSPPSTPVQWPASNPDWVTLTYANKLISASGKWELSVCLSVSTPGICSINSQFSLDAAETLLVNHTKPQQVIIIVVSGFAPPPPPPPK